MYLFLQALSLFIVSLPNVRSEPSLASPALSLAMALMAHPDGLLWLVKNGEEWRGVMNTTVSYICMIDIKDKVN